MVFLLRIKYCNYVINNIDEVLLYIKVVIINLYSIAFDKVN